MLKRLFFSFLIAKIYYGLSISDEDWENAYYMAPITGAVLSKVLSDYIMDYPILHPRYQPFTVVEKQSGLPVLNSSNSEDFVWNIFRKLADMYVAIDPILAPKRYAIQLMVEDVQRDVVRLDSNVVLTSSDVSNGSGGTHERKQNVANFAADFFHNLFACVEAIKTGDYSAYKDTDVPSLAPSTSSPTASPTLAPSSSPTTASPTVKTTEQVTQKAAGNATEVKTGGGGKKHHNKNKNNNATDTSSGGGTNGTIVESNATDTTSGGGTNGTIVENTESTEDDDGLADVDNRYLQSINDVVEQIENIETELNDEDSSENIDDNFVDDAKEAADEAEKAAEAAKEAADLNDDVKAAEAAVIAAEAAKKAAQATSDAAAEAAIESLLSGDGDMMTNVIQTCFSDPKYGIQEFADEENDLPPSTNAYLYVDGSHYYRLNLTAPFFKVQPSINSLPKTNMVPLGKSDVVDIGLAFAIIGGFCFGVIVILHHIRVLNWDERLQFKWFFHPTASGSKKTKRGGYSNTSTREAHDDDSVSTGGDLELADRQIPNGSH